MAMSAALVLLLVLPCPVREEARRDTIGEAIEVDRYHQILSPGPWSYDRKRQRFANPELGGLGLRSVRQGQDVYRWRDRPLSIVHNYFCSSSASGATMPDRCDAVAFVLRAPGPDEDSSEYADELGRVKGDFGTVEPHPTLPIFAAVLYGWSDQGQDDGGALLSVHDLAGRTLCPRRYVDLGTEAGEVWPKLPIAGGLLACPGGNRVKVPAWDPRLGGR